MFEDLSSVSFDCSLLETITLSSNKVPLVDLSTNASNWSQNRHENLSYPVGWNCLFKSFLGLG